MRTPKKRRRAMVAMAVLPLLAALGSSPPALALDPSRAIHQYVSRVWSVEHGLPQNSVKSIAQTPDGYIWLATEEGIVRFDGITFTVFNEANTPEIANNDFTALCVDAGGTLWMGSQGGGLLSLERARFTSFRAAEGLGDDRVMSLACAEAGEVWVGTTRGISHRRAGAFVNVDGVPSESVLALRLDDDGTLWAGTDGGGLVKLEHGSVVQTLGLKDGLLSENVTAVHRAKDGALWLGGRGTVTRMKDGALRHYAEKDGIPRTVINAILDDRDGAVWLGGHEGGVLRLYQDVWSAFTVDRGLAEEGIGKFFEDREGNLWIGTEGGGAQRLANPKVVTYSKYDGITGGLIWCVFEDSKGYIWAGSRGGGAHRMAPDGTVKTYSTAAGLPSNVIYGIAEDREGRMWFATGGGGAARLEGTTFTVYGTKEGVAGAWVRAAFPDSHGNVWLATEGHGLDRLRDGKITHYGTKDVLRSNTIRMVTETRDGWVWFGTEGGGVTRFKDERFETFMKKDGLSDDSADSVTLDDAGDLWIGTYHGLSRVRDGKFTSATTKQGLFNNLVYTTLAGPGGSLWMSSNVGISELSKKEFDEYARGQRPALTTKSYGTSDGMRSAEGDGGSPAGIRAKDGRLWFANLAGVVMVDPAALVSKHPPPSVIIESFEVNRKPVALAADVKLEAGGKDFQLIYTAPSFVEPERIRFRYKLDGWDKDWVYAGTRRAAYYTNLAPGQYKFRVSASGGDGVWDEKGAELSVYLAPFFYQTRLFYAACALAVALLGATIAGFRVRQLKVQTKKLERRVAERTAELGLALHALEAKDKRISEDLDQAREFQQRMLPALPTKTRLRFGAAYRPADQVGGDIYDVCEIDEKTIRVFLADTTGHGVQASLRTMVLRTEYDAVKQTAGGPADALAAVNRRLFARYPGLELRCNAVCFDVREDEGGGAHVTYANAAQPPLLHLSGGAVGEVYVPGPFLGMVDEIAPRTAEVKLARGDVLLAYTDGVYEQEDAKGLPFGLEAIGDVMKENGASPPDIVAKLVARVEAYAAGPLADDVTLVCVGCSSSAKPGIAAPDAPRPA